jgi:hypothetical protein
VVEFVANTNLQFPLPPPLPYWPLPKIKTVLSMDFRVQTNCKLLLVLHARRKDTFSGFYGVFLFLKLPPWLKTG